MNGTEHVSSENDWDCNSSSSQSDDDSSSEQINGAPVVYKNRTFFHDNEEYAKYVRDKIQVGMTVKCCRTYEEVHEGDIGKVVKVRETHV